MRVREKHKSQIIVLAFLVLFLFPMLGQTEFLSSSSYAPTTGDESQFNTFELAGDGDESDQSLTSFSPTISEDVLFYPDGSFVNSTSVYADAGDSDAADSNPDIQTGSYTDTAAVDGTNYVIGDNDGVDIWILLNFTVPTYATIEGFDYSTYAWGESVATPTDNDTFEIWNFDTTTWVELDELNDGSLGWINGTTYVSDYWSDVIMFRYYGYGIAASDARLEVDYAGLEFYYMTLADSDHYAESFADVSDLTTLDTSISTDGDVAIITENGAGNFGGAYYEFASTRNFVNYYYEVRATVEAGAGWKLRFYDHSASWWYDVFYAVTSGTRRGIFTSIHDDVDRIGVFVFGEGKYVKPDYLRISRSNETGFQHDCSTTAGTDAGSSDGDLINITSSITFDIDTTATAALLETSYYPFVDLYLDDGAGNVLVEASADGSSWSTIVSSTAITADTHYRGNVLAASIDIKQLRVNVTSWATLDYIKLASIANFTVTQSGAGTDDYLYTSSGVLHSNIDTGYIEANHDPALSVASASYPVWNLTTGSTAPQFSDYVSSWSSYSSETRGALQSGTVTDIKLKFAADGDISAITFIEDSTAPTVVRTNANPPEPDDDETLTISSVVTDPTEVHSVKFNAITAPSGFSDVDYSATEQTDNLWTYSFSAGELPNGYYCFKVIASDGANENGLTTEQEFVDFTVRESAIIIEEITLIGAGADFTTMTFSARINKDCTYTIYEESENNPETDTYTGSLSAPSFNLAWGKLDTTDKNVNFTIKFVNGSLTENYTSQYQVAQTTFYVEWGSDNGPQFSEDVKVTGRITKLATYTVFIDDINATSGTLTSLDFEIEFDKKLTNAARESWHDFSIKFTNGSQTTWYNSSMYLWKNDPDQPPGGGVVVFDPDFWLKIMIVMIGVTIGGVVVMKATGIGNLPDYKGGT